MIPSIPSCSLNCLFAVLVVPFAESFNPEEVQLVYELGVAHALGVISKDMA